MKKSQLDKIQEKVKELLPEPQIRELINLQPRFHLEVKDDEAWFGTSFPEGVDELYFRVPWWVGRY